MCHSGQQKVTAISIFDMTPLQEYYQCSFAVTVIIIDIIGASSSEEMRDLQWQCCRPECRVVAKDLFRDINADTVEQFCHAGHKE